MPTPGHAAGESLDWQLNGELAGRTQRHRGSRQHVQVGVERVGAAQAPARGPQGVDRISGGDGLVVIRGIDRKIRDDVSLVVDPPGDTAETTVASGEGRISHPW